MKNVIAYLITFLLSVVSFSVARSPSLRETASLSLRETNPSNEDTVQVVTTPSLQSGEDTVQVVTTPSLQSGEDTVQVVTDTLTRTQEVSQDSIRKVLINYMADTLSVNNPIYEGRTLLKWNVVFSHDSSFMYSDSAYYFETDETLEAFSNVRLEQGDTLFVYGDYLFFDSKIELAQMRYNAKMVSIQQDSSEVILYTDSLDYNLQTDIGYYFEGGRIIDVENELVSVYGEYSPTTKIAFFIDSVCLTNPNFILYTDTLEYSTETKIAHFIGPTIIESDSGVVHSTRGWYNTQDNTSLLLDRSQVFSGNRVLTGDSIMYNRDFGFGEAFGNMSIIDTMQKTILTGHYGYYEEKTEYAFVTDSACAIEYSQGDTLFLYADTLEMVTIDSTSRILHGFMGARFYRFDLQGICDSFRFDTKDSVLYMYGNPVLWNEEQQLFGDSIIIYMSDSTVDYVHVPTSAFVVQEIEPGYYNQLGGNDLKAYFIGRQIDYIDIDGNAESIFYPVEQDSSLLGLNYTQSSYLSIWFIEGKLDKLKIWPNPTGKMIPIPDLTPEQKTLKKFAWYDDLRPVDRYDIFRFYNERKRGRDDPPPTPQETEPEKPPILLDSNYKELNNVNYKVPPGTTP